jgi:DNA-binding MarR family transcriptional regulator
MSRPSLVSQGKPRKYEVKNLYDKHHQVLRLTALGTMSQKDIARAVNLTPQMVSNIVNSTLGQDLLKTIRGTLDKQVIDISQAVKDLTPKAIETIGDLMDSDNEKIRLAAAMDILDRGGYAAPKNLNVSHTHKLSQADIEGIKSRCVASGLLGTVEMPTSDEMKALADLSGAVDVEFSDVKEEIDNGSNNLCV